ncbi:hypothetical protein HPB49_014541 [Dermacentor silvarum]|uniref:Uncharacterized protein n=1 Tax=Dermacentor silvarum TaxID=543639 RepID=A0ACB8CXR9_DERSI|nr:hypothetical protein HPB49_014541 [Dermacentor silvarum]
MAANAKKRTTLTFAAKLEAIQRVGNGEKSSVAEAFGIPRSTLSTLLKNKGNIKAKAEKSQHSGARRVRKAAFEDVEKALHEWFIDARARNIPISGPILQQKAQNFAFILGAENFSASRGWLQRFKTRFDIAGKTLRMGQDLKIDLLGAIQMLKASWDNVKQSTIANCFQHAGFAGCTDEASVEESEDAGLACADEESELAETWSKLESFVGAEPQSMCIDDFVGGDDSTGTTAELTNVEIVAKVTAEQPNENAAEMDPASADYAPLPTSAEVIAALALVRRHCGAIEGTGLSLVDRLDYIEDAVVKHAIANKKQATLFQYFKPTQ